MSSAIAVTAAFNAADRLAAYAAGLRYEDLPAQIVTTAKACLIDAAACAIFGVRFPWSRSIAGVIDASGSSGPCTVPGFGRRLDPRQAALALGAPSLTPLSSTACASPAPAPIPAPPSRCPPSPWRRRRGRAAGT